MRNILILAALAVSTVLHAEEWTPKQAPLMTVWGEKVTAVATFNQKPRL